MKVTTPPANGNASRIISWRREYIRLLSEGPKPGPEGDAEPELDLMRELIEGDYATGSVIKGAEGSVMAVAWEGPNVKGRMLVDQLEAELKKESWSHKLKMWAVTVGSLIVGVFTAWLIHQITE